MKENDIVRKIRDYLKVVPNCFCWKEHGGVYSQAGIPDIICCVGGRFVALEVKAENGKVSMLQELTLRMIRRSGGVAEVVRSAEEVKQVIEKLRGGICEWKS